MEENQINTNDSNNLEENINPDFNLEEKNTVEFFYIIFYKYYKLIFFFSNILLFNINFIKIYKMKRKIFMRIKKRKKNKDKKTRLYHFIIQYWSYI